MARIIEIPESITVGSLAEHLAIPVSKLITELFKNGIMTTVNEKIDVDTANIIVGELGLDVELTALVAQASAAPLKRELSASAQTRPPVVAVMGHVDHGKTSLLDRIRSANTAKAEAGGITQHISAYQVTKGDRLITFLDTPGHEAFAALREHGAMLTDVVVIVVAADDGVKPQTLEAIRFARKANVKVLVALNKIDKEGADANRVKQQLAEAELLTEEWGGDIVIVPVSAKTGEGVEKLLDMILLIADVEDLRADTNVPSEGLIIESHMQQGKGPLAVALVEHGILKTGQFVVAGGTYAKVRTLTNTSGSAIKAAGPSTPVIISGFKQLPEFGDPFICVDSEKEARAAAEVGALAQAERAKTTTMTSGELLRLISRKRELSELNVIIKADVQGSLTSVADSLKTIGNEEVAVRFVASGVGSINDNDVRMAAASQAVIYGFNVDMPSNIRQTAARLKVPVRLFRVIYELLDDAKVELTALLAPEIVETELGRLIIRGIFKTTKHEVICGGEVTKGRLIAPSQAKVMRGDEVLAEVEVVGLKRGPQEAREILESEMCGVSFKSSSRVDVAEGDRLEFFTRETKARTL